MPVYDSRCLSCDWAGERLEKIGEHPPCPHCGGTTEHVWVPRGGRYFQDDIPGGLVLENLGHHPVTVYSHSERLRIMKARGLQEAVYHVPMPGTDKSPHTTSWSVGLPPGVDARPFCMLSAEEQEERHRQWLATEPN